MTLIDLTGRWTGSFSFADNDGPTTSFTIQLRDDGGVVAGTCVEPNSIGSGDLESGVEGDHNGSKIEFVKSYVPGTFRVFGRPVNYFGDISGDGSTITGVWSLSDTHGTFTMARS